MIFQPKTLVALAAVVALLVDVPLMAGTTNSPVWEPIDWNAIRSSTPPDRFPGATPDSDDFSMSVTTDLLIYGRTGAESADTAFDGSGNAVLNLSNFDFGAQVGPCVSVLLGGRRSGIEWRFFTFNNHSIAETVNDAGITPVFFGGIPVNPASSYDVRADARLVNNELNFWHNACPRFRYGLGLRWLELDERFDILNGDVANAGFFSNTKNDLGGGQILGGLTLLSGRRCFLEVVGKSGIYRNDLKLDGLTANDELHVDDDTASWVVEITVVAEWLVGRHVSLRSGYGVLWLDDVASAADQNNNFDIFTGSGSFDLDRPVYQGGFLGLQARW